MSAAGRPAGRNAPGDPSAIVVLVPVKDLEQAKTRLAPLLSREERRGLALLMLEGVLAEVARVKGVRSRVVVTSYAPAIALAGRLGCEVLRETHQVSESASVDAASAQLEREGVTGVLRVPLDLPLFQASALSPVLAEAHAGRRAVLVPSRDGTGTNALYRAPPTLFPSRFGPDSLRLHREAARRLTDQVAVLPVPALGLDIDDGADVAELLRRNQPCPALDYLRALDAGTRLAGLQSAAT
jgi:2-phospho-L-lactate guanylyltransferase